MKRKLHDTKSAAKHLGGEDNPLKENTLEIWRVQGRGPRWIKIGRLVRYDEADLDAYLESQTRTSTSDATA